MCRHGGENGDQGFLTGNESGEREFFGNNNPLISDSPTTGHVKSMP
jgi:hypothetical protein